MGTKANQISTGDNLKNDLYYRVTSAVSSNKTKCVTFKTLQSLNPISEVTTSNYSTAGKTYSFAQAGTTTIVEKYEAAMDLTVCSGFSINMNYSIKTLNSSFYPFRFDCSKFGGNNITIWLGSISGSITKSSITSSTGDVYAEIMISIGASSSAIVLNKRIQVTPGGTVNFTCENSTISTSINLSSLSPAPNIYNGTTKCGVAGCGYVQCHVSFTDNIGNVFEPMNGDYIKITNTPRIKVYCPDKLAKHDIIKDLTAVVPMYLGLINKTGGNAISLNYIRLQAKYANGTENYIAKNNDVSTPSKGSYKQWHYFVPLYNDTLTPSVYGTSSYAKGSCGETTLNYKWVMYGTGSSGGNNILENYDSKMQRSTINMGYKNDAESINTDLTKPVDGLSQKIFLLELLRDNKGIYCVNFAKNSTSF